MEFITKYTPRKLSTQAIDYIKFAHSNEMQRKHYKGDGITPAIAFNEYPNNATLNKATARNWFNDYTVVKYHGEQFVVKNTQYNDLKKALNERSLTIYYDNIISCAEYDEEMERLHLWNESNKQRGYGPIVFRMEDVLNNTQLHLEGANPDEALLNFELNRAKTNFEECSIGEARAALMQAIEHAEDMKQDYIDSIGTIYCTRTGKIRDEALGELKDLYIRLALMEGETFKSWYELNKKFDAYMEELEADLY